jgi:hypothetical protein
MKTLKTPDLRDASACLLAAHTHFHDDEGVM